MKDQDHYAFTSKVRPYGGTNIARCNGQTASCTSSDRKAAEGAALKAFERMCGTLGMDPNPYQVGSVPMAAGIYEVNFTRVP